MHAQGSSRGVRLSSPPYVARFLPLQGGPPGVLRSELVLFQCGIRSGCRDGIAARHSSLARPSISAGVFAVADARWGPTASGALHASLSLTTCVIAADSRSQFA